VRRPADRASCALGHFATTPTEPPHGGRRPIRCFSESPSPSASGLRTCGRRGRAVPSVLRTTRREQLETTDAAPLGSPTARTPLRVSFTRASTIQRVGMIRTTDD
jgi:hypothetical protein